MPWAKHIKDDQKSVLYSNLVDVLIEHASSDKNFTLRDLFVRSEMLKFDFTKRQRAIMTFIFGTSYNFGKMTSIIPMLRDFELCGVQASKAASELQKLVDMDVISWDKETNEFAVKDPRGWNAPKNYGYNQERAREVFMINLKHLGIDVDSIIKKSLEKGGQF